LVATQTISPRVRELTIDSPALGRSAKVRLLLPRRFSAEPGRRWPVLWLLHGCCDTYMSWTRSTDVEEQARLAHVLVVMPEAGQVGFYSDWRSPGRDGPSRWETFHLTELRQLLERDWRAGNRRVVAGLSMPLAVFFLRSYMATLPTSVVESAKVDGASHFRIFWRVVLPLSLPALAAFATFEFLWVWNDLLIALLYLGTGERQVVTVTLGGLIGSNQIYGWQLVTGGAIITMAVPVLVFVSLQRYFVRGLTAGAVGG
jgi:hypothetical protein